MTITAEQMREFAGGGAAPLAKVLDDAATRWEINTPLRVAHWMAQMAHESQGFTHMRESLNYAAEALVARFRGRISETDAFKYGRTPEHPADQMEIANKIYGGEWGRINLGNTQPGDGWRYIGRGLIQLTGKENYATASRALFNDDRLIYHPELLEEPEAAALSAGWFWSKRGLNALADADDLEAITKKINGGLIGLDHRKYFVERFKEAL
jgi:putative chitinase